VAIEYLRNFARLEPAAREMARNYPVWARSLVDPESFENEQIRLGQVWTLVCVPTQGIVPDPFREGEGVVAEGKSTVSAARVQEGEGKTSR